MEKNKPFFFFSSHTEAIEELWKREREREREREWMSQWGISLDVQEEKYHHLARSGDFVFPKTKISFFLLAFLNNTNIRYLLWLSFGGEYLNLHGAS